MRVERESRDDAIVRQSKHIEVVSVTPNIAQYRVKDYLVTFDKRKLSQPWSCTCVHGSWYRGAKQEQCKHIEATKARVLREGAFNWETDTNTP